MAETARDKETQPPGFRVTTEPPDEEIRSAPRPVRDASSASLLSLLRTESEARRAATERELTFLIVNETRVLVRARQVFVLRRRRANQFHVKAVSSLDAVDRSSPLIRWVERIVKRLHKDAGLGELREFVLPAYCDEKDTESRTYPFRNFLWVPLELRDGDVFAGMLLTREQAWLSADTVVAKRLAGCFGHAWAALTGERPLRRQHALKSVLAAACAVGVAAAMAIPVPLAVLAPGQVIPKDPYIIAAPIDGIVDEIVVDPNARVAKNHLLLRFVDTTLRNELELAESQVLLAESRLKRQSQAAFVDDEAKRELRLTISELHLKQTERDYAADLLSKATVRAPQSGIAVFTSKRDWKGKPVSAGERIMRIADPGNVEVEVRLPVDDAIELPADGRVKLFLDSDPLNAREARIVHVSHEATPDATNVLSYRVVARLSEPDAAVPRIGEHGTAQLFGDKVPLFYYLFRRPITALRQHTGL